jgi:F0F1-type ATP synthase membrane subunit b/b'
VNEFASVIDAQVEALLQLVEDYRERQCRQILDHAHAEAATVVKHAHRDARARMHKVVEEERVRSQEKIASTHAQLQTQRRQAQQQADTVLLQQAWDALQGRLLARWQDAGSRRTWVQALVRQARALLPAKKWQIEHPVGWRTQELLGPSRELGGQGDGKLPAFVETPEISAGLRIRIDDACLDGTPAGLLASRAEVEAQLLAQFHRLAMQRRAAAKRGKTES